MQVIKSNIHNMTDCPSRFGGFTITVADCRSCQSVSALRNPSADSKRSSGDLDRHLVTIPASSSSISEFKDRGSTGESNRTF